MQLETAYKLQAVILGTVTSVRVAKENNCQNRSL